MRAARNAARLPPLIVGALIAGSLAGCAAGPQNTGRGLAVSVLVEPLAADPAPWHARRRYLLTPHRGLRIARGPKAKRRTHPPLARRVSPNAMARVRAWIRRHRLLAEPTSPLAVALARGKANRRPRALYTVVIRAGGRRHRYRTTPGESPPTERLVRLLHRLARPSGRGGG